MKPLAAPAPSATGWLLRVDARSCAILPLPAAGLGTAEPGPGAPPPETAPLLSLHPAPEGGWTEAAAAAVLQRLLPAHPQLVVELQGDAVWCEEQSWPLGSARDWEIWAQQCRPASVASIAAIDPLATQDGVALVRLWGARRCPLEPWWRALSRLLGGAQEVEWLLAGAPLGADAVPAAWRRAAAQRRALLPRSLAATALTLSLLLLAYRFHEDATARAAVDRAVAEAGAELSRGAPQLAAATIARRTLEAEAADWAGLERERLAWCRRMEALGLACAQTGWQVRELGVDTAAPVPSGGSAVWVSAWVPAAAGSSGEDGARVQAWVAAVERSPVWGRPAAVAVERRADGGLSLRASWPADPAHVSGKSLPQPDAGGAPPSA